MLATRTLGKIAITSNISAPSFTSSGHPSEFPKIANPMAALKLTQRRSARQRGVALVIVMAILALILVTVVAFLSTATIERGTAKAFTNNLQSKLAAESGLAAAIQTLTRTPSGSTKAITQNDLFVVVRSENADAVPYYSVGLAREEAGSGDTTGNLPSQRQIDYLPLVSGGVAQSGIGGDKVPPVDQLLPPPYAASTHAEIKVYPGMPKPSAKWVTVEAPKPNGSALPPTRIRYAYWVEDLGGYLDIGYNPDTVKYPAAGNADENSNRHKRPYDVSGTPAEVLNNRYKSSPKELALYTLFSNTTFPDPGNTKAKVIVDDRPTIVTPWTAAQATGNADAIKYVATGYFFEDEPVLIPRGFGYKDEGKAAFHLNGNLSSTQANVEAIAKVIADNLPKFANARKGGLTALDYNKSIAASIIDYADADSDATVGTDYRGIDSYPLVSEIYNSKWWKRTYQQSGTFWVEIQMETWVELWNMTNRTVEGSVEFQLKEEHPVTIGFNSYNFGEPEGPYHTIVHPSGPSISVTNMQPNEYRVILIRRDTFQYDTGVSPPLSFPPSTGPQSLALLGTTTSKYEMKWNGKLVDRANGGAARNVKSLRFSSNQSAEQKWSGTIPGFAGSTTPGGAGPFFNSLGDPRSAFVLGVAQASNDYDTNGSMGGRNIRSGINLPSSGPDYREVKPSNWPDGGHNSPTGRPTGTANPAAGSFAQEPTKAPTFISNRGSYLTGAELGNIYDPGQWNIIPDSNRRWVDITNSTQASDRYGGGFTLRIGRPEFTRFDQPGVRAAQLLDLFTPEKRVTTRGKVNVNTASRDVLRALGGGLRVNRDPDIQPQNPDRTVPSNSLHADVFADAVIANRPFLSTSQLARLACFGDPTKYTTSAPTEWNDAGREEYFAKVYPLSAVRSRNFRVFVTGQVLDRNNRPIATTNRVYQIQLRPDRDNTDPTNINSQAAYVVYEGTL
ncbi:MAG: hypothetical protein JSR82_16000 [Verrucomicrobia bacterium]|nr:hypothetical protein [Verrucomicrobiota bacterium]